MQTRRPIAVALLVLALTSFAPCSPASGGEDSELHGAARAGDVEKVKELLRAGADVDGEGWFGETPLHLAAFEGHRELTALLIEKGADVSAKDEYASTPLHEAAWGGHPEVAALC